MTSTSSPRRDGMGSVFYDASRGTWCAQVYGRNERGERRRHKRSFPTEAEARAALPALRRQWDATPGALRKPRETQRGEGSVFYDRSRERWVAQVRFREGARRRAKTAVRLTEREAREALQEMTAAHVEGRAAVPDASAPFSAWLRFYAEHVLLEEGLAAESVAIGQGYVRRELLTSPLAPLALRSLTPLDVMRYLNSLVDDGRSSSTRKGIRVALNKALKSAILHGRLDASFALALQGQTTKRAIRSAKARRAKPKVVAQDAARALAAAAEPEGWEPLVMTLLGTGLRRGEALALRWRDLDLDAGTMDYVGAIAGDGAGGEAYGPTKTGEESPGEPLAPQVVEALRRQRAAQNRARLAYRGPWAAGQEFDDFVFTNGEGQRYTADWVTKRVIALSEGAGLGHITPHMLRHSAATFLAQAGVDPRIIARVLHHASDRVTREVYIHDHELEAARQRGTAALTAYLQEVAAAE